MLSTKAGKEVYVEPVIENGGYRFTVKTRQDQETPRQAQVVRRAAKAQGFHCLMSAYRSRTTISASEGKAGRMGARLMAIVAEGDRGRVYLPPTPEMEAVARKLQIPSWKPDNALPDEPTGFQDSAQLRTDDVGGSFHARQLVALTTFSDLVQEARERVEARCAGRRICQTMSSRSLTAALAQLHMLMQ